MTGVDGKVAIVTGAGSGIGRGIAVTLAKNGAKVVAADINTAAAAGVLAELGADGSFLKLDVTNWEQWEALTSRTLSDYGTLDILVNNAGVLLPGSIEDLSLETWRKTMAINVDGVFYGCRAAVRAMRKNPNGGAIVNLSSTSGFRADPDLAAYDASKGAVRSLTKEIAVYCARKGYRIRCNSVHPGTVATPMLDQFFADPEIRASHYDSWMNSVPIGRPGAPEDIANLVMFLASSRSSFMTGAECTVDGGVTA